MRGSRLTWELCAPSAAQTRRMRSSALLKKKKPPRIAHTKIEINSRSSPAHPPKAFASAARTSRSGRTGFPLPPGFQSIRSIKRRVDRIVRTIAPKHGSRHRVRFPRARLTVRQHRSVVSAKHAVHHGRRGFLVHPPLRRGGREHRVESHLFVRDRLCCRLHSCRAKILRPRSGSSRARALAIARARVRRRACTTCDERACVKPSSSVPPLGRSFRRRGRPDPDRDAHPPRRMVTMMRGASSWYPG